MPRPFLTSPLSGPLRLFERLQTAETSSYHHKSIKYIMTGNNCKTDRKEKKSKNVHRDESPEKSMHTLPSVYDARSLLLLHKFPFLVSDNRFLCSTVCLRCIRRRRVRFISEMLHLHWRKESEMVFVLLQEFPWNLLRTINNACSLSLSLYSSLRSATLFARCFRCPLNSLAGSWCRTKLKQKKK